MAQGPPTFRVPLLLTIACTPILASMIEKGQMFPTPCDSVLKASFPLTSLTVPSLPLPSQWDFM